MEMVKIINTYLTCFIFRTFKRKHVVENFISAPINCAPCLYQTPAHMFVLEVQNVGRDQFIASLLPLHEIVSD
jgi:hypothetical protein